MLWRAVCHTFRMTLHTHSREHPAERIIPVQKSTEHFLFASDAILLHIPFILSSLTLCSMALPLAQFNPCLPHSWPPAHLQPLRHSTQLACNQFKPEHNLLQGPFSIHEYALRTHPLPHGQTRAKAIGLRGRLDGTRFRGKQ
jgi:hypothetical protein